MPKPSLSTLSSCGFVAAGLDRVMVTTAVKQEATGLGAELQDITCILLVPLVRSSFDIF